MDVFADSEKILIPEFVFSTSSLVLWSCDSQRHAITHLKHNYPIRIKNNCCYVT